MAFVYNTNFNSPKETLSIDGQNIEITPLVSSKEDTNNVSFFATTSDSKDSSLTLYWTTSAGNVSSPEPLRGPDLPLSINHSIETLHENKGIVYIGGEFTAPYKKICAIDTNTNTVLDNILAPYGPLVDYGSIKTIATYEDYLILGGDFKGNAEQGGVLGKGLAIINVATKQHFPFFINGTVNAVEVHKNFLYIGGNFDFINYTAQPISELTGLRVYTKGLVRIDLTKLEQFPQHSIDREFIAYCSSMLNKIPTINAVSSIGEHLYIGGNFEIEDNNVLTTQTKTFKCKSIVRMSSVGGFDTTWDPILNGEVSCIKFYRDNIYVGGKFDYFSLNRDLHLTNLDSVNKNSNLVRFNTKHSELLYDNSWIPNSDGCVTSLAFQGRYVYVYGSFNQFNGKESGHLAACTVDSADELVLWPYYLQSGPTSNTGQSVIALKTKMLVGGTFLQCNGNVKPFITYLPFVNPNDEAEVSKLTLNTYVYSHGNKITLKSSSQQKEVIPNNPAYINTTTFNIESEDLNGCIPGTLVKFSLQRVYNENDSITSPICLLGWSYSS